MRLWIVVLLCALPAVAQDEEKKAEEKKPKPPTAAEIDLGEPGVEVQDATAARREVTRFQKDFKAAKRDQKKCFEAIQRLGKWDHPLVLGEVKKILKHKNHLVAIEGVRAVARQRKDKKKTGATLLGALSREKREHVRCALIVAMGVVGYDNPKARKEALKYLRKDTKETHKAATRYFGYIKDKTVFRLLAERLDEPVSKSPNSPTNPPASWWRERWMEWDSNVKWTRWALAQLIPGETFDSTDEAKNWAESEGKKHGIEW